MIRYDTFANQLPKVSALIRYDTFASELVEHIALVYRAKLVRHARSKHYTLFTHLKQAFSVLSGGFVR